MTKIPKNRNINIPTNLWKNLDEMFMNIHKRHITKEDIITILERVTERW